MNEGLCKDTVEQNDCLCSISAGEIHLVNIMLPWKRNSPENTLDLPILEKVACMLLLFTTANTYVVRGESGHNLLSSLASFMGMWQGEFGTESRGFSTVPYLKLCQPAHSLNHVDAVDVTKPKQRKCLMMSSTFKIILTQGTPFHWDVMQGKNQTLLWGVKRARNVVPLLRRCFGVNHLLEILTTKGNPGKSKSRLKCCTQRSKVVFPPVSDDIGACIQLNEEEGKNVIRELKRGNSSIQTPKETHQMDTLSGIWF